MIHQKQPTANSCICACVAMVTGIQVATILSRFHSRVWDDGMSLGEILEQMGVQHHQAFYGPQALYYGKVYLLAVPSLNTPGSFHQVIADCRGESPVILDPAQGIDGKQYYAWHPEKGVDPLAVHLTSWMLEYEVVPHD